MFSDIHVNNGAKHKSKRICVVGEWDMVQTYHDAPSIRNLCEVYTIAGVDCIDVAADESIIRAAKEGICSGLARGFSQADQRPLLMISINDDSDPHFRKAVFEVKDCLTGGIDYVEIHTGRGHLEQFANTWEGIEDAVVHNLKLVAVSFPDLGTDAEMGYALREMWTVMSRSRRFLDAELTLVWQTDGRPMSGDIGDVTATKSVKLAQRVVWLLKRKSIPGHVQLAGGTNSSTVARMGDAGLLRWSNGAHTTRNSMHTASGIAVGGYARKIVKEKLPDKYDTPLSDEELLAAVEVASRLVFSLKSHYLKR